MNGTIAKCLGELVCNRYGMSTWLAILDIAAARADSTFSTGDDVSDEDMLLLTDATMSVLSLSRDDAFSAFVRGLATHYGPRSENPRASGISVIEATPTELDLTG